MINLYQKLIKRPTGSNGDDTEINEQILEVMGEQSHVNPRILGSSEAGYIRSGNFVKNQYPLQIPIDFV